MRWISNDPIHPMGRGRQLFASSTKAWSLRLRALIWDTRRAGLAPALRRGSG